MRFIVFLILFCVLIFGSVLSQVTVGEGQTTPVSQPVGKESKSKEELKKWELTSQLLRISSDYFNQTNIIDRSIQDIAVIPANIAYSPDCSRAPPVSAV
ncbi:hypothetical protein Pan153_39060 [Gimesia panareensis]|uniref:Uncharacterized protein n=1 Tax=Gimesia panareensis TaxID=2527978 RepID=A0A518FSB3_9PLAN|nr:hypothetical protein [Gimesia panareensis]QDV19241.1 hypothetical protein Pan153_39060 [Gimesia panareensis]